MKQFKIFSAAFVMAFAMSMNCEAARNLPETTKPEAAKARMMTMQRMSEARGATPIRVVIGRGEAAHMVDMRGQDYIQNVKGGKKSYYVLKK
jgi:hypothetical protein